MKSLIEVAVAMVLQERQVLICQRLKDTHLGGFWEFPGGKILAGEEPRQAALRELLEETGLEAQVVESWPVIAFDYPERRVRLHPFLCRYLRGRAHPLGCQKLQWIEIADLNAYRFPPANEAMLRGLESLSLPI